ncbi:MAG: tetratricopeptide repeat protein [Calditrichaceae bacterium]|nr:tetratricopeptide repeat protein [Calditrichaceae bacterium]
MSDIGYNDNVSVSNRTFHIQTASNVKKGTARCEVFEQGKIISTHDLEFERRRSLGEDSLEGRVREIVSTLHQETIEEIELMFQIRDKVKKLKHSPSNIKLGLIFLQNNLIKDAIEQFELALSIDPDSGDALNKLGLAHIKLGQNITAMNYFKTAIEKGYNYADVYHNLGLALLNEKQHYKALNNFQEAIRINPKYALAQYNLAIVYLESISLDKSENVLPPPSIRMERANQLLAKLETDYSNGFEKISSKVSDALSQKDLTSAINILINNRDKVFPPEIDSLIGMDFYLKFMYGGRKLNAELIQRFEDRLSLAIEKNNNYADLWNSLGIVHLIQCRNLFLQALSEFDKSLELNPSFDKALKNKKLVENDGKEFLILLRAILK